MTVLRRVADPIRLTSILPLRVARALGLAVARRARRWELSVEHSLVDPVVLHWDGHDTVPTFHRRAG